MFCAQTTNNPSQPSKLDNGWGIYSTYLNCNPNNIWIVKSKIITHLLQCLASKINMSAGNTDRGSELLKKIFSTKEYRLSHEISNVGVKTQ